MRKELFIVILVVICIIGISVLLRYVIFKDHAKTSANYNSKPLMECVQCIDNKTWENKPCCDRDFSGLCSDKEGVIRFRDLHPLFSGLLQACYQKAPDIGTACASGKDCLSGVCNFSNAIASKVCSLTKKDITGRSQLGNEEFFTATYSCSTKNPGKCAAAIENISNSAGVSHYFKMDGNNLVEVQEPGPQN